MKDKIFLKNILISSSINLPEVLKTQFELGFFVVCSNKDDVRTGFVFGASRQIVLPIIKLIDLKVLMKFNYFCLNVLILKGQLWFE